MTHSYGKIYMTGASGFIGTNLTRILAPGRDVVTIGRDASGDLVLPDDLDAGSTVIHLGALVHRPETPAEAYRHANLTQTQRIFDLFLSSRADTFIYMSSASVYGTYYRSTPFKEEDAGTPDTPYGHSKLAAEEYIMSHLPANGTKRVYILRPAMVYGPGDKGNPALMRKLARRGVIWPFGAVSNRRSFCSVDFLAEVTRRLIEERPAGNVFNLASPTPLSTNELFKIISEQEGHRPHIVSVPMPLLRAISRIGDRLRCLPLDTQRLSKLADDYILDTSKLSTALDISPAEEIAAISSVNPVS